MNTKTGNSLIPVLLLPAMVIIAYISLWSRPLVRDVTAARGKLRGLGMIEQIKSQRVGLHSEAQRLREELANMAGGEPTAVAAAAVEPASALRRLQEIFRQRHIRMFDAATVGRNTGGGTPVESAFSALDYKNTERWRATLQAPYPAIVELLNDCAATLPPIVIESLTLTIAGTDKQAPYWAIQLCL